MKSRQLTLKSRQSGFTMIELIVVIVILGVLAATALPRFINMRGDAERAAIEGVAGAATAAMNLNYSGCALTSNVVTPDKCVTVNDCADVKKVLQGGVPTGYVVTTPAPLGTVNGVSASAGCTVTKTGAGDAGTYTATFTGVAAGNVVASP